MDGEPKEGTSGWDSTDTSTPKQPDTSLHTQEDAETPRYRKIFEIVSTKYPTPDFIKRATDGYGKPFDQFDKEEQDYLNYLPLTYGHNLTQLAKGIDETQVKEEEIEEYVDAIDNLARNTLTSKMVGTAFTAPERFLQEMNSGVKASENLDRVKLWLELSDAWNKRYPAANQEAEDNNKRNFSSMVTLLSGSNRYPRPEPIPIDQTRNLANVYMDAFAVIDTLPIERDYHKPRIRQELGGGVEALIRDTHNEEYVRNLLDLYDNIKDEDPALIARFLDITSRFARHHGLDQETKTGLLTKLLPMLRSKDPQVDLLQEPSNNWGMEPKSFGVADFLVYTLAHKVTPLSINENLMVLKEVPTTIPARFEQNRKDALALAGTFGILRDFIHDQQPYVHEVLTAMVDYYYTGNRTKLLGVLDKTKYFQRQDSEDLVLDRSRYNQFARNEDQIGGEVPAIQILKRLVENTTPIDNKPPHTSDTQLNKLMEQLDDGKLGGIPDRQLLQTTLDHLNSQLVGMIQAGEVGMEPNLVKALAWIDQQAFRALEDLSFEDQQSLFKTPLMRSLLLFDELTNSSKLFNQQEFDQFMEQLNQSTPQEAYKSIQTRVLRNVSQLASHYKAKDRGHVIGALWSGNTTHALIGLTDYKQAETVLGKRFKKEAEMRRVDPSYHPGD